MKRYIKPNTEMHVVELQSMIAATTEQLYNKGNLGDNTSGFTFGGKETEISSNSVWDEEE
jgi:hypothetical protein